ncbi:hypothetical protein [Variovorax sp.]|jgi:hypothetical protein|uniref:hypothetical protein n=1 Tax=Variovorax sp. TaxID=1871043 RepID=UPI0025FD4131|nr:hypothetical protein [Variovorax sp.]
MAREKPISHENPAGQLVQGRSVAALGRGMALVKVGKSPRPVVRPEDKTTVLLKKAARALGKPGIDRSEVFRGPNAAKVYAYSAYPQDLSKVVREAADGTKVIGRMVDGRFRASKA